MRRQAQIVLGSKIDATYFVAAVVLCPANGFRPGFRRAGKWPEVVLAAQVLPLVKAFRALEEIRPTGHAEISHAAGQRCRRNIGVGFVCSRYVSLVRCLSSWLLC